MTAAPPPVGTRVTWKRTHPDDPAGVAGTVAGWHRTRGTVRLTVEWDDGAPDWWSRDVPPSSLAECP